MEILAGIFMILLGLVIAGAVLVGFAAGNRNSEQRNVRTAAPDRNTIAVSILVQLAQLGGASRADAATIAREESGVTALSAGDIDIASWATAFSRMAAAADRQWLLDAAVRTAMRTGAELPLGQYNALVDLSFALGFQTDALARLRTQYDFSFEDYAKRNRPRSADRGATVAPLFERRPVDHAKLLAVLGLRGNVTRHEVISAYRRLAARNHPDRFHDQPPDEQQAAAIRFMEITDAYERLLQEFPES